MENSTIIIYEYMLINNEFTVIEHEAEIRKEGELFIFRGKGKGASYRFIEPKQLGVPKSRRICALDKNDEKYKELLIKNTKERISALTEKLEKENEILMILERGKNV